MPEKRLRVGLVGLRGINWWMYRSAVSKHPRAELVAGCDPNVEAAEKFHKETGGPEGLMSVAILEASLLASERGRKVLISEVAGTDGGGPLVTNDCQLSSPGAD